MTGAAMKTKSRIAERNQARRQDIRDAAVRCFSRIGYDRTSLKDIADAVGLTHPALYYYYQSKDAILYEAVAGNVREMLDGLRDALEAHKGAPVTTRLLAAAEYQVLFQLKYRGMAPLTDSVLFGPLSRADVLTAEARSALTKLQRELVTVYRDQIEEGRSLGVFAVENAAMATFTILGALSYVVYWFRDDGPQKQEAVAGMVARFCLSALHSSA